MATTLLFFVGFILLIKSAGFLVDGASSLARRLGISALVIGLTIVSFGTSAPELVVNLAASIEGNTDIAIGNILGSNIANILLILGLSAAVYPLTVSKGTVWKEIPFALLAVMVVAVMANDALIDGAATSVLSRIDGMVLIGFFIIFLYYIFGLTTAVPGSTSEAATEEPKQYSFMRSGLMIGAGLIGLALGANWIVDGAVAFARYFSVSEALIGLTIVAIGTSLPELATSVMAAYKKDVDIAVGNVVGSNIFNIFWILGVSAAISPLPFSTLFTADIVTALIATLLLFFALFVGKRHTIERSQGIAFVGFYIAYLAYLVLRG